MEQSQSQDHQTQDNIAQAFGQGIDVGQSSFNDFHHGHAVRGVKHQHLTTYNQVSAYAGVW